MTRKLERELKQCSVRSHSSKPIAKIEAAATRGDVGGERGGVCRVATRERRRCGRKSTAPLKRRCGLQQPTVERCTTSARAKILAAAMTSWTGRRAEGGEASGDAGRGSCRRWHGKQFTDSAKPPRLESLGRVACARGEPSGWTRTRRERCERTTLPVVACERLVREITHSTNRVCLYKLVRGAHGVRPADVQYVSLYEN